MTILRRGQVIANTTTKDSSPQQLLEEIMTMSDRIVVIYRSEFIDVLERETMTLETIGLLMAGGKGNPI